MDDLVSVLLVEDDADDYTLTRDYLSEIAGRRFHLDWVATYDAALEAIRRQEHHVYLLDYRLGERNGLELLREAVRLGARKPMILLTGQGDREVDMEAMRTGAADYLIKEQLDPSLLERAIRYAIEHKRTEEALRQMQEELERRVQERTAELGRANQGLQAEVGERKRAEEQIKASLHEKEVLLREIHHRVKNNLQVICSLLTLQSRYIKDPQALEMFKETQGRVKSMAVIHQKLYQAKDLARINFAQHIQDLATSILRTYATGASVALKTEVEDVVLGIDTVIPCTLIIHELLTNCLKYAFPDGRRGEIRIALQEEKDRRYRLTVRDNGIGLPKGLDYRNAPSLGLQLVIALTDQLEGTLQMVQDGGTSVVITFRDIKYKERG
ncbi:MAG: response regulator [Gemmataceae bacterium]|nr:response regulator [Gemmataceae bacterium]